MIDAQLTPAPWKTFSAAERESFFAAIARHRRDSWRATAACAVAVLVLALVISILMAPLLYSLIALTLDVVNLLVRTPDLMGALGRRINGLASADHVSVAELAKLGAVAALPGLALMAVATLGLLRIWRNSPLFDGGDVPGRAPDRTRLSEARLANVVEEMAIAAGIPPPRVVIVPGGVNAAACGRDEAHVTLLAGEALAGGVDREQLQGMIAHLIGSIADGDMTIGLRVTTTLALFGLVARVGGSFTNRHAFREATSLWRLFVAPTSQRTAEFLGAMADPFADADRGVGQGDTTADNGSLTWREWLLMPLMGPVLLTGFLSGMVGHFALEPLIAVAWRQRKYMADATAVQLTRDPDALARTLEATAESPKGISPWTAHLAVAPDSRAVGGPFGNSVVPIFPAAEKRVAALVHMGAQIELKPRQRIPRPVLAVLVALLAVMGALLGAAAYLVVLASMGLSALFTLVPAALLHMLLRWMAS